MKALHDALKNVEVKDGGFAVRFADAAFPEPFVSGLEYASPARGTWNIVHTGMLVPEAHEIFVCGAGCLRGVVLTAAEMGAMHRFSTIAVRDNDFLDGTLEELLIEGVADVVNKLSYRPKALLVYTSCMHHFAGCDLDAVYRELNERFPEIDITDCYMNPIMRKSGLTPDQLMRRQLYAALKPMEKDPKKVAVLGNDFATDDESELVKICRDNGYLFMEINRMQTYEEYLSLAEADTYITYYPSAEAGADALCKRIGGTHLHLPMAFSYRQTRENLMRLCEHLQVECPDFEALEKRCEEAFAKAKAVIGDRKIVLDYTFAPHPVCLARFLLDHGFLVERVYLDAMTSLEAEDFRYMQKHYPDVLLVATVNAKMRFFEEPSDVLAIGQKAAGFTGTNYFVNVVEGGGMYGYEAFLKLAMLLTEAATVPKDRKEIEIKGLGSDACPGCGGNV